MTNQAATDERAERVDETTIRRLVDHFYARVRTDPALGPVFARRIADDAWPAHLATIADFWANAMLGARRYQGNAFGKHARIGELTPELFTRWLALFEASARELCSPAVADAFVAKAQLIARSLQAGLFFRPHPAGRES